MQLKTLKLINFRSYTDIQVQFDSNMNVLIGRNDIGKSTILEALDIFFGQDKVKIDISDKNVFQGESMTITCEFSIDLNKKYLIDSEVRTNLADEYLLNENKCLEIKKVWNCTKDKLTQSSMKTFMVCNYPSAYSNKPLPLLKIEELKKVLANEELAINLSEKLNNGELPNLNIGLEIGEYSPEYNKKIPIDIDKRKRAEIRKAIYSVSDTQIKEEIEIPIDKEDCKNIWNSISVDLPLFFLFQSDRVNKDSDKEVQDPLKAITKSAINDVIEKLEEVKEIIKKKANDIGHETIEKLKEMNPELASVLKPEVTNKAWDSLFSFSFIGDDNIPMNKRGSGVRRLILLNYFRAEADRKNPNKKNVIYAIEEPETSQHPNHQTLLVNALKEISQKDGCQIIMTTHSPEIAKQTNKENLLFIDKVNGKTEIVNGDNKLKLISEALGITTYLGKVVICVEGENDINFIRNINQNIPELKKIIDIKKENIKIIPMGGSALKNWVDRHYLKGSNITEFHLYDRDANRQYLSSIEKVNNRNDKSVGFLTNKREMENYIHRDIYKKHFQVDCSNIIEWDDEDIAKFITQKHPKFDEEKYVKMIINGKLSKDLTKEYLEDMGAFGEVEQWFKELNKIYVNC